MLIGSTVTKIVPETDPKYKEVVEKYRRSYSLRCGPKPSLTTHFRPKASPYG